MEQIILQAENIIRSFPSAGGEIPVLRGISLTIPKGKLVIIKGRSGSGKTTLLNILSALDPATAGEVILRVKADKKKRNADDEAGESTEVLTNTREVRYSALSDSQRDRLRRNHMGFVFQSVALVPIMTAYENVDFGLRTAGYVKASGKNKDPQAFRDKRIKDVLASVGLAERMQHLPSQLSGGEQQRVAIARAMAHKPEIIFADEPTGALDTAAGLAVTQLFKELAEKEKVTIVMTTHDPGLMELGDVVYEIEDGTIL